MMKNDKLLNFIDDDSAVVLPEKSYFSSVIELKKNKIPNLKRDIKIELNSIAIYDCLKPKVACNRYYLEFIIKNPIEKKNWVESDTLITIMQNPSITFPDFETRTIKIDDTIKNVISMAYVCGYNRVIILNVFSLICGNSGKTIKFLQNNLSQNKTDINAKFISNYLKNCEKKFQNFDFLAAWGENENILSEIEKKNFSSIINKYANLIWAYRLNDSNTPTHPSKYNTYRFVYPFINKIIDNKQKNKPIIIKSIGSDGKIFEYKQ